MGMGHGSTRAWHASCTCKPLGGMWIKSGGTATAMSFNSMSDAQQPYDALASRLKRTELQRSASSIPSREIVQELTEIPAGVESGWHTHPGEEVSYILAGTVEMLIQGRPAQTLHTGDAILIPSRVPHNALVGSEVGKVLSTYIVEVGQPLSIFTT